MTYYYALSPNILGEVNTSKGAKSAIKEQKNK